MKLFDYIKVVFGKDQDWDALSSYDKSRNAFMLNRMMSAKFPIQASLFNALKTSPTGAAEAWRMVGSKFNRVPGFIYTKVAKKHKPKQKWEPDPLVLEEYLKLNQIGMREYEEALKYDEASVRKGIDTLHKMMATGNGNKL